MPPGRCQWLLACSDRWCREQRETSEAMAEGKRGRVAHNPPSVINGSRPRQNGGEQCSSGRQGEKALTGGPRCAVPLAPKRAITLVTPPVTPLLMLLPSPPTDASATPSTSEGPAGARQPGRARGLDGRGGARAGGSAIEVELLLCAATPPRTHTHTPATSPSIFSSAAR